MVHEFTVNTLMLCRKSHGHEATFQERNLRQPGLPRPPTDAAHYDHYEELPIASPPQTAAKEKRLEAKLVELDEKALDDPPPGAYDCVGFNKHSDEPESATAEQKDDVKTEQEDDIEKTASL